MSQLTAAQKAITPGTYVQTLTGNTGGAVGPNGSGNINVVGDGTSITDAGNPGTNTITISLVSPVPIANGGTNATSFSNTDGVVYFNGTRLVDTTVGTAGQVLTSNGTGVAPTFQNSGGGGGITTIDGDTGSVTGSTVSIVANDSMNNSGSTVSFSGSATTLLFNVSDGNGNTIIGNTAGNGTFTGTLNTGLGVGAFGALTSGASNIGFGAFALAAETSGSFNVAIGDSTLQSSVGQTGNVGIGHQALSSVPSGSNNISIGSLSGTAYSSTESSNILFNHPGSPGESNTLRIGAASGSGSGTLSAAYIYGVNGITVTSPVMVVLDSSTEQWGTQAIPGGGGISTINGDTGTSVSGSTISIIANASSISNAGQSVNFSGTSSTTLQLNVSDSSRNTTIGLRAGQAGTATSNTVLGYNSLSGGIGGDNNVALGDGVLTSLTEGERNTCLGSECGSSYTGSESDNILIGASVAGTTGENNTLRLGNGTGTAGGQLSFSYISGINGAAIGTSSPVLVNSSDQLGTSVSSLRFKDNVTDMSDSSSALLELRPVNFTFKGDKTHYQQWGLIAEEVYEVFPAIVNLDEEGNPYSVRYHDMPAILLRELQKAVRRIEYLENKLANIC